jgi:hypothetical protein
VRTEDHAPKSPAPRTGLFATLANLLPARGTGAPSPSSRAKGRGASTFSLLVALALTALAFLAFTATALAAPHTYKESLPAPTGGFHEPWGVAVGTAGELFVSNHGANVIDVYEGGLFKKEFSVGTSGDHLNQVAVDPTTGDLYVVDFTANKILKFSYSPSGGGTLTPVGSPISESEPHGVAVDSSGDVYISRFALIEEVEEGFIVSKYGPTGTLINGQLIPQTGEAEEGTPSSLAVDSSGDVYAAGVNGVRPFNGETGACLLSGCAKVGEIRRAGGVAIGPEGNLYETHIESSEPQTEVVKVYEPNGTLVESFDPTHLINEGHGIAVTGTAGHSTVYETSSTGNAVAVFTQGPPSFKLNLSTSGTGSGTFKCKVLPSVTEETCAAEYEEGKEVEVIAHESAGSEFVNWTGDCTGAGSCVVTMSAEKSVNGVFNLEPGHDNLTVNVTGEGSVECKVGAGSFGPCQPTYTEGSLLTLHPVAGPHATFEGWNSGTGSAASCSGTGDCSFTINSNSSVNAPFPLIQRTLTTSKAGTGNGSFECKTTGSFGACLSSYPDGTTIVIKATEDSHSTFVSWAGCSSSAGKECTVSSINANTTVTATFNLAQRTLTINKTGTGNGSFECKTTGSFGACASSYTDGETITVKATPDSHSTFTGWSGGGCSGTGECAIPAINANTTISAAFPLAQRTLTTSKTGTGNGTFQCKTTGSFGACAASYTDGKTITVKATPDSHSVFVKWEGCSSTAGTECTITSINANTTVTATINLAPRALTVTNAGTGSGSVTCDGGACASTYPDGTTVTLAATAASGSTFAGFSGGGCSGTGACVVTMVADTTVTATFTANPPPPPPPPPAETAGTAKAAATASVKSGKAALKLTCSGGACKGTLKLTAKVGGKNKVIGKASFSLASGASETLNVKLSGPAKQELAKGHTLKAKLSGTGIASSTVKLKPAKK